MYMFIQCIRDKKRLCFLGIKTNKPSFCPSHNFSKIQIEKFSSGIWVFNYYTQAGIIRILETVSVTMLLIKSRKRRGPRISSNPEEHQLELTFHALTQHQEEQLSPDISFLCINSLR